MPAEDKRTSKYVPFPKTRWSLVLAAGAVEDDGDARAAWESLASSYWYPLYAYARRRGAGRQQSQDLVQGFFTRLLEKDRLQADPDKGRFRSYLLTAFQNYQAKEHRKESALKRGGGSQIISIDVDGDDGEARLALEPSHQETPERVFLRTWAKTVLERVFDRLQEGYAKRGKEAFFLKVKADLLEESPQATSEERARELGMTAGALRVALHRLRKTYRESLHEEIAQTLVDADMNDIEDELRQLFAALRS